MSLGMTRIHSVEGERLEDPVGDAGAGAVWLQSAVDPVGPELILEVEGANADLFCQLEINAAAESDIGEAAVRLVVFEVHTAKADEGFSIGGRIEAFEFVYRNFGADEVVVLGDVDEGILTQPASLGFNADPARGFEVGVDAKAEEGIVAGLGRAATGIIGLKDRTHSTNGQCQLSAIGRWSDLRARSKSGAKKTAKNDKRDSFHK